MALSESDFVSTVDVFAPALRRLQRVSGIQSSLLLQRVAETVGQELAKALTSNSSNTVVEELSLLFELLGLGRIGVEKKGSDLRLTVNECSGCEQVPDVAVGATCVLREGILKAIFDDHLGTNSNVRLLESHGSESGAKTCKFVVRLTRPSVSESR